MLTVIAFRTTWGFGLFNLRSIDLRHSFAFILDFPTLSQISKMLAQSSEPLSSSGVTLSTNGIKQYSFLNSETQRNKYRK